MGTEANFYEHKKYTYHGIEDRPCLLLHLEIDPLRMARWWIHLIVSFCLVCTKMSSRVPDPNVHILGRIEEVVSLSFSFRRDLFRSFYGSSLSHNVRLQMSW